MAFGTDSYSIVKNLKCPVCLGPLETVIKKDTTFYGLIYAKCAENNCKFRQDQLVDIRAKSIEKIELNEAEG